jgi:hypothetical protein
VPSHVTASPHLKIHDQPSPSHQTLWDNPHA